ncbi:MAG: copper-binding protein [Rhodothermia bacterium]|nr:copper-binding protein [Rhodothermia bacterium]
MRIHPKPLLLASILLLAGACGAQDKSDRQPEHGDSQDTLSNSAPVLYDADGLIKSITPNRKHMVVAHGDIPGFMDAMTMPFAVADTALLAGVSSGDSIRFEIAVDGPKIRVRSLEVVE